MSLTTIDAASVDQPPRIEMAPWITFSFTGATTAVAIVEQSTTLGTLAIGVALVNLVWDKFNQNKERNRRAELERINSRMNTIETKLDMILIADSRDSRHNLPRVPRGDGADADA